ncbi:MAG: cellulase family glycosylhydrolase [Actinomycetota bacterium]
MRRPSGTSHARRAVRWALVGALALYSMAPTASNAATPAPWYRTQGQSFVDANGKPVILRGVNVHPSHAVGPVATIGSKVARVFVRWSDIEPNAPAGSTHTWSANKLTQLDSMVAGLRSRGVAVELDLHQCGWSSYWASIRSGGCNAGIPDWYYADGRFPLTNEGRDAAIAAWWTTEADRSHAAYLPFVQMMVRRYSSDANVIGFGLFNEPPEGALGETTEATNAMLAWQVPVAQAVRAIDPVRTIFFMCRDDAAGVGTADLSQITSVGHTVLDWHDYVSGLPGVTFDAAGDNLVSSSGAPIYMHQVATYTGTLAAQQAVLAVPAAQAAAAGIPLFVGEWGAKRGTVNVKTYQSQMFTAFDALGLSWARWSLSRTDSFALENPDGTLTDAGRQIKRRLT